MQTYQLIKLNTFLLLPSITTYNRNIHTIQSTKQLSVTILTNILANIRLGII
jgi:hypothetical protein